MVFIIIILMIMIEIHIETYTLIAFTKITRTSLKKYPL